MLMMFAVLLPGSVAHASADLTVTVSAKHSVHFAGQDAMALAQLADFLDSNSNQLPSGLTVEPRFVADLRDPSVIPIANDITTFGPRISICAEGMWDHGTTGRYTSGPDGRGVFQITDPAYETFGISRVETDLNMLVGVFLGPGGATLPVPSSLGPGDAMTQPQLGQAFAIGSHLDNIFVPAGATTLYLGLHDGIEWNNNHDSVQATIKAVPEPASVLTWVALMGLLVGTSVWKKRKLATSSSQLTP